MADEHLRSDDDVEAILRLAVQQSGTTTGDLRSRLMATADELGLTEDQVIAAEEAYRRQKAGELQRESEEQEDKRLWKEFRKSKRGDWISHLGSYVAVNGFLVAIDLMGDGRLNWAFWPLMGWGIGMAIHTFTYLAGETSESMAEFEKWKRKKKRRSAVTGQDS